MIGELVPLVMIPRFTSYVGEGTFTTLALDVSAFGKANVEFWRGALMGGSDPTPAEFEAVFEEANQADTEEADWTAIGSAITTPSANDLVSLEFTKKYFRIRIDLTASNLGSAAITAWAAGNLELRIRGEPPA